MGIDQNLVSSAPLDAGHWTVEMQNHSSTTDGDFDVFVMCAKAAVAPTAHGN